MLLQYVYGVIKPIYKTTETIQHNSKSISILNRSATGLIKPLNLKTTFDGVWYDILINEM